MIRTVLFVTGILAAALVSDAQAQNQGGNRPSRYQPSRPTISPYLNLYRPDVGPLPNYYSLVRPQIREIENQQRQQVINQQQRNAVQNLNRSVLEMANPAVRPTGTGSVSRYYSHYYPGKQQ